MNRLTKSSNINELYVVDHEKVNPDANGYSGETTHIYRLEKYGWKFVILLIFCMIVYNFPWAQKIDTTIQGVQCRIGDADYSEDVSIIVKGVYKQYLVKNDIFEGTVSIDKYDSTLAIPMSTAHFHNGNASLEYITYSKAGKILNIHTLGFLSCTPNFDRLFIGVYEPIDGDSKSWNGNNGLIICAPANNRVEALSVAKILLSKSKVLSQVNWE